MPIRETIDNSQNHKPSPSGKIVYAVGQPLKSMVRSTQASRNFGSLTKLMYFLLDRFFFKL